MTAPEKSRVCLGEILGPHGLKGEVRVHAFTEAPSDFAAYGTLQDESGARRLEVAELRETAKGLVVRFDGVASREAAEALGRMKLYVPRERLPETEPGDWYHADLVGLVALSQAGSALGTVLAVQNYGAGDLLEIRPATGGETVLVPFTEAVVPDIDIEGGWLLLVPPEGVFE